MLNPDYVAAFIVTSTKPYKYLLLKRAKGTYLEGIWQMVTGKIARDERADAAARREIFEETGFRAENLYNIDANLFFDKKSGQIALSANFLCKMPQDFEVNLSPTEHETFGFFTFEEACKLLAFPSQKLTLELIHTHFVLDTPHEANLISFSKDVNP